MCIMWNGPCVLPDQTRPDQTRAVASVVESDVRAGVRVLALYIRTQLNTSPFLEILWVANPLASSLLSLVVENNNINTRDYLPEQINGWNQAF